MSGFNLDIDCGYGCKIGFATASCVAWSLGTAQVTYPVTGPITLGFAVYETVTRPFRQKRSHDDTLWSSWRPFAMATVTLVPVLGGIAASKMID